MMHEICFFVFTLNENACLSALNLIFCSFWRVHLWMHETFWIFEWKCMLECM